MCNTNSSTPTMYGKQSLAMGNIVASKNMKKPPISEEFWSSKLYILPAKKSVLQKVLVVHYFSLNNPGITLLGHIKDTPSSASCFSQRP